MPGPLQPNIVDSGAESGNQGSGGAYPAMWLRVEPPGPPPPGPEDWYGPAWFGDDWFGDWE